MKPIHAFIITVLLLLSATAAKIVSTPAIAQMPPEAHRSAIVTRYTAVEDFVAAQWRMNAQGRMWDARGGCR